MTLRFITWFTHPQLLKLRSDLHNLVSWSDEWQMLFNIENVKLKCKVMHLGYDNPKADYVMGTAMYQ